ncbi:MAG: transposase [Hyphomicrobiales bacterium]|nr:transposase [Hyphomicrobiales bacterium]MCP5076430.1 transposase [Paracoccaceae bacterium]
MSSGMDVQSACRAVGVSDATYYTWRKKFGGMGGSQLWPPASPDKGYAGGHGLIQHDVPKVLRLQLYLRRTGRLARRSENGSCSWRAPSPANPGQDRTLAPDS